MGKTYNMLNKVWRCRREVRFWLLPVMFLLPVSMSWAAVEHELLTFVDQALTRSDAAYEIMDNRELSRIDIEGARHRFNTVVVPLTSFGIVQGTGSQKLGVEMRKLTETGTSVSYGVVGDRVDENSNYVIENTHTARAYVRVSQGLFRRWGTEYNRTDLDVAELRDKQKQIDSELRLRSIILSTSRKYYALILEDQLLTKSEQALERSKEHLASAKSRQSVGLVSKVDVYRAELAVLNAENSLYNQMREKRRAEDDFREQLRLAEETPLAWQPAIAKITPFLPESVEEVVLENRMDWQDYLMRERIAKREQYRVDRDLMPDVGVSFTVEQYGEGDSIEEAVKLDETNWSLQLEMLSTLDTFNEESAILKKNIELSRLRREGDNLKRKISREVRDGLDDLLTMERQHQLNLRQLEQAGMALDLAQIRYEKGLSDNLDIIDAENAYSDAELAISRSLAAYNNAAIHLANVMGILSTDWLRVSLADQTGDVQ